MQVDPTESKLKPPGTKRLKPKCDILLSTPAFKLNSRRYIGEDVTPRELEETLRLEYRTKLLNPRCGQRSTRLSIPTSHYQPRCTHAINSCVTLLVSLYSPYPTRTSH